ncbi:MAG: Lrp/AsnC family transcriptional regulator [Promethearchaeota archaeon]
MDEFDFQILKILDKNCRISYSKISQLLNVSVRNISRRVENILATGVIEKFKISFNYNRLGFRQHIAFLQPPKKKDIYGFFNELSNVPEIERIWYQLDGGYTFTIFSKNAKHLEDINIELLKIGAALTGRAEVRMHLPGDIPFSLMDWKIIYYMFDNSRASIAEIALDLDVSEKTISRRLKRLENMRLIQYTLVINFEKIIEMSTGIASFETVGPSKNIYGKIKKTKSIKYWRNAGSVSPSIVLFLYGKNITEIYDMYAMLAAYEDIKTSRLSIVVKNQENSSLIKDEIYKKILT